MSRNALRLIIVLGVLSILGIVLTQVYWVQKAFDLKEKQFTHRTNIALKSVADQLLEESLDSTARLESIRQLSSNYYTVEFNRAIDPSRLEFFLLEQFENHKIEVDFEYALFECFSDSFVYGQYVDRSSIDKIRTITFKPTNDENFYFGVLFPTKSSMLVGQMRLWIFFSIVLFLVTIFFAYTLMAILKQKRLSEIRDDFINNMTHEFKTPISTISVSSEVLQQDGISQNPERLKKYASIIEFEAKRLKTQVENVLNTSIIDSKLNLSKERLSVNELLQQVCDNFQHVASKSNGTIKTDLIAKEDTVYADPIHLSNVFFNLFDNALKYNDKKPIIEIKTTNTKGRIRISVSDNGKGMTKKEIKFIFDKFYRVPSGDRHDVKGFGIGLYYVKSIIKAHKGKIEVYSDPGNGTTFTISIPLTK